MAKKFAINLLTNKMASIATYTKDIRQALRKIAANVKLSFMSVQSIIEGQSVNAFFTVGWFVKFLLGTNSLF